LTQTKITTFDFTSFAYQAVMADIEARITTEENHILSLSEDIIASVGRLRADMPPPRLDMFRTPDDDSAMYPPRIPGYNFRLLLTFEDETRWVIKFPLFARTAIGMVSRKVESEVATTRWVAANTSIPVPTIHAFDATGKEEWNATRRPCIIMNYARGERMTEKTWKELRGEKQHKVIQQVARIITELASHHFSEIGCLYKSRAGPTTVGPLVTEGLSRNMYGSEHIDLFFAPKSPYDSVIEYFIDLANMFLVYEVASTRTAADSGAKAPDHFVRMWVCRSLLPAYVVDEYNRGPFVLRHSGLERRRVFFDKDFNLTDVINWEWSQTVPMQTAACIPPFIGRPPGKIQNKMHEKWYRQTRIQYDEAVAISERLHNKKSPLHITQLVKTTRRMLSMEIALTGGRNALDTTFWEDVFRPVFGTIDVASFFKFYNDAPGIQDEFIRIRNYIWAKFLEALVPLMPC
jgi:hypothetical protein